jgi:hypothetical protein
MTDRTKPTSGEYYEMINPGIAAHAQWYYVSRLVDGAKPQPVRKMTFEAPMHVVAKIQCK